MGRTCLSATRGRGATMLRAFWRRISGRTIEREWAASKPGLKHASSAGVGGELMSAAPDERLQETISLQVLTTEGQEIAGLVTPPAIVSGSANVPLAEGIAAQLNVPL